MSNYLGRRKWLQFCEKCYQMTNHRTYTVESTSFPVCMKCGNKSVEPSHKEE